MSEKNTGGPAFPSGLIDPSTPQDAVQPIFPGMTLRDYFAAKSLQGLLANPNVIQRNQSGGWTLATDFTEFDMVEFAFDLADLAIKGR